MRWEWDMNCMGMGQGWDRYRTGMGWGWDRYGMVQHGWISCIWHTTLLTAVPQALRLSCLTFTFIILQFVPFPDDDVLKDDLLTRLNWEAYKSAILNQTLRNIKDNKPKYAWKQ